MKAVKDLLSRNSELSKELELLQKDKAKNIKGELKAKIQSFNDLNVLNEIVDLYSVPPILSTMNLEICFM